MGFLLDQAVTGIVRTAFLCPVPFHPKPPYMSFRPFRHWWMLAFKGVLLILFGAYILFEPGVALAGLVLYLGIAAVASGVLEIVLAFSNSGDRGSYVFDGILDILIGVLLLWRPEVMGLIPILLGAWMAISGLAMLMRALRQRRAGEASWASWLVLSIVLVALGAQLIIDPVGSMISVTWILGMVLLLFGLLLVFLSLKVRRVGARIAEAAQKLQDRTA